MRSLNPPAPRASKAVMSNSYEPQPACPAEWQDHYALSDVVLAVPVKKDAGMKDRVSLHNEAIFTAWVVLMGKILRGQ